jgi:hypothetical protein
MTTLTLAKRVARLIAQPIDLATEVSIDIIQIRKDVEQRLDYMFDETGTLIDEYKTLYESKRRHMLRATLHVLLEHYEPKRIVAKKW